MATCLPIRISGTIVTCCQLCINVVSAVASYSQHILFCFADHCAKVGKMDFQKQNALTVGYEMSHLRDFGWFKSWRPRSPAFALAATKNFNSMLLALFLIRNMLTNSLCLSMWTGCKFEFLMYYQLAPMLALLAERAPQVTAEFCTSGSVFREIIRFVASLYQAFLNRRQPCCAVFSCVILASGVCVCAQL